MAHQPEISRRSKVVVIKDILSTDLSGEAAILNLKNGIYYGLDPIGARIWNLVQRPTTFTEIRDTILDEYDVEREKCESDILLLLGQLAAEGLIEVVEETAE